jgi:hypothetical protein
MLVACCIPKAIDKHSEYGILIVFHCNNGFQNAPECYVISVLFLLWLLCCMSRQPTIKRKIQDLDFADTINQQMRLYTFAQSHIVGLKQHVSVAVVTIRVSDNINVISM